ncbi:glycoside hydrolase family 20 zincin-like fold domain-containing protein [Arthrobacter psychrolactophilus]
MTPSNDQVPTVVPSLAEWSGRSGVVEITVESRIVASSALLTLAEQFSADLAEMTGLNLPVISGTSQPGDICLVLNRADSHLDGGERYEKEGYKLDIS